MIDVLIVGAGPTGLMLGILLKRMGLTFRIIDQNDGPAKESRALGIQARTLELFHSIGIVDEFLKKGMKARGAKIHLNGKEKVSLNIEDMERADTLFPYLFLLSQHDTEEILLRNLKQEVERETKLKSFVDFGDHVECELEGDFGFDVTRARYLCGCDGAHSMVRKKLGIEFKGDSYESQFIMADTKVEWDSEYDLLQVFLEKGKAAVFFPLKDKNLSRVLAVSELKNKTPTTVTTQFSAKLDEVEAGFKSASHKKVRFHDPEWVTRFHIHHRSVDQMRKGNVFLLGDAAHIHSPLGAQGMNTGLQDASNLAWKLKIGTDDVLDTYQSERHPIAVKLLSFTDRLFSMVISKNRGTIALRNFALPIIAKTLMSFPLGKRMLFGFISELNIHYGDKYRAPNAKMLNGENLHDLMAGYEFQVLAFKREGFNDIEKARIGHEAQSMGIKKVIFLTDKNASDEVFRFYQINESGLMLVRPDGYIESRVEDLGQKLDYSLLKTHQVANDWDQPVSQYMH